MEVYFDLGNRVKKSGGMIKNKKICSSVRFSLPLSPPKTTNSPTPQHHYDHYDHQHQQPLVHHHHCDHHNHQHPLVHHDSQDIRSFRSGLAGWHLMRWAIGYLQSTRFNYDNDDDDASNDNDDDSNGYK